MTEAVTQQAVDAYVRNNPVLEKFVEAAIRIGELKIVDQKEACEHENGNQNRN